MWLNGDSGAEEFRAWVPVACAVSWVRVWLSVGVWM